MKQAYVQYTSEWRPSPLTLWVYGDDQPAHPADLSWLLAPIPGKGYQRFFVEIDGFTFEFCSLAELDACVATLSKKLLPSSALETRRRKLPPQRHWLNQMPNFTKPWRYREKAVKYLQRARAEFAKVEQT